MPIIPNKYLLLQALICVSCTTNKQPPIVSEWVDLKSVDSHICESWPTSERDLEVKSVVPLISEKSNGFAASIKQRNASMLHAFFPTGKDLKVNRDEPRLLPLGQNSVILAVWQLSAAPFVVVANNSGSRSTLEARSVSDNRVIARSAFVLDGNIREADVSIDGDEMWLALRTGDYSTLFVRLKVKGTSGQFDKIPATSESRGAVIVADKKTHTAFIVENQSQGENLALKFTSLKKDFAPGQPQVLHMEAKGGVESWAVASGAGGLHVAAITGDSMVGQGVLNVNFAALKDGVANWSKKDSLKYPDLHISEPVWISTGSGAILTLMKWLDSEATMSVASVTADAVDFRKDRGVHGRGSVVMSGFLPSKNVLATVVRKKNDELWQYSVCRSDL